MVIYNYFYRLDWLALKKKYLAVQKSNMATLKRQLRERKYVVSSTASLEMVPNVVVKITGEGLNKEKVKVMSILFYYFVVLNSGIY